jgi:hypothetical protein
MSGIRHLLGVTVIGGATVCIAAFVFIQGVSFLQADLMQEFESGDDSFAIEFERGDDSFAIEEEQPFLEEERPSSQPTPIPLPPVAGTTAPPPVLNLGQASSMTPEAVPSVVRINRYTVGSSFVPTFAPTEQIPVDTIRRTQQQVHSVSQRVMAKEQPKTGPGLLTIALAGLGALPFVRKRLRSS